MDTPESIELSLQEGVWITSLDFRYAYFHISINLRSKKYLSFHLNGQTCQVQDSSLWPGNCSSGDHKVVMKVNLMAQSKGLGIYQCLHWLLIAPCQDTCQQNILTLLTLCQDLGWVVNMNKLELIPQTGFNFVVYHFNLSQGLVRPSTNSKDADRVGESDLLIATDHIFNRFPNSNRQIAHIRTSSHETYSVAPEKTTGMCWSPRKDYSSTQFILPSSKMVAVQIQHASNFVPLSQVRKPGNWILLDYPG